MEISATKKLLLALMPALVFVPLFIGSRLIFEDVPEWMDWTLIVVSAGSMALNPWLTQVKRAWTRGVLYVIGFLWWSFAPFYLAFVIMVVVFQDGL